VPAFTRRWRQPLLRPFLAIGILGGFTTFSALALQGLELLQSGAISTALIYLLGSVVVGVGAAHLGMSISDRHHLRRMSTLEDLA
jgi:CrcB protein